jgi:elongation factor G
VKDYELKRIRNFAVVGHATSGKTTLCEAMLATTGAIKRIGTIEGRTTTSDYHEDEREHGNSIHATLLRMEWLETELNVIDTPGFPDFVGEALCAIKVVDFALIVIDAVEGIGFGTERMWQAATDLGIPKFLVINGTDRERSSVENVVSQVRSAFGDNVLPMTLPLDEGVGCSSFLDAMRSEVIVYKDDTSGKFDEAIPEEADKKRVDELHRQLVEYVAESDDALLEKYFENGGLSEDELRERLHAAVQTQVFVPLFCVAAKSNVGIARLVDFIAKFGSSPIDRKVVTCETPDGEPIDVDVEGSEPVIFIFKTLVEEHVGALSYFRAYSGELKTGTNLENTVRGGSERIGQILLPNGKNRESTDHLRSGELGALVKLKNTHSSDTLCSSKYLARLTKIEFPTANIHAALNTESRGDEEKIGEGLALIREEDPTFTYRYDPTLRQTILSGQGQLHLESVVETLKRRYNVDIALIPPRIPYRETIRRPADSRYRHKKQSGGAGQFAEVWMRIKPGLRDSGVQFRHSLVGNNVDRGFVPSVEKGVRAAGEEGILAGYEVCDLDVDFYDGKQHPVDSKDIAFQIAGKHALREAFLNAEPHLIEPILEVQIRVTGDALGSTLGDLSARGGRVIGTNTEGHFQLVTAEVPQRNMYAYANDLRSLTGGRGAHSETFSRYEDMPRDAAEKVIAESKNIR